jgi:hypothetical protein
MLAIKGTNRSLFTSYSFKTLSDASLACLNAVCEPICDSFSGADSEVAGDAGRSCTCGWLTRVGCMVVIECRIASECGVDTFYLQTQLLDIALGMIVDEKSTGDGKVGG